MDEPSCPFLSYNLYLGVLLSPGVGLLFAVGGLSVAVTVLMQVLVSPNEFVEEGLL